MDIYICITLCICVYIHICVYMYLYAYMCICIHACLHLCVCSCVCTEDERSENGIYYLFIFGCVGSLLLGGLSLVRASRRGYSLVAVAWASHCSGFSCCQAQALGHMGFSSCGSWTQEHRLNSCGPLS